jgi:zinc and cadmium transporter
MWLVVYCALVLVASLAGGYVPFLGKVSHSRLQLYLSLSAGVMLGASFFHVMPEAIELSRTPSGNNFGWWMSLGVIGLFAIERFIAPHSHEIDGGAHAHGHEGHSHHHAHDEHRAAAPAVAGWMAVLGLTLHTFMNGVGLAGSVLADLDHGHGHSHHGHQHIMLLGVPGLAMFLAIVLHKPADALAISVVLSRKGVSARKLAWVQIGFALMVPVGAAAFAFTEGQIEDDLHDKLTGAALAVSAGTFLFIALSDLQPEVQFHRHDRFWLFLALVAGLVLMGGIGYLEVIGGHSH